MDTSASRPPQTKRPDYHSRHAKPLPLNVTAYPPLIPHNPLSLLQILFTFFFSRPSCLPSPLYTATFNEVTRCVHVTDERSMLALWNDGFFGKGSLSRSEPTWLSRRRRELGIIGRDEALTAEEITERRRKERKDFKLERARAEKERIQKQLEQEGKLEGKLDVSAGQISEAAVFEVNLEGDVSNLTGPAPVSVVSRTTNSGRTPELVDVENLEHLQLTPEETFFLVYGLGCLEVMDAGSNVSASYSNRVGDSGLTCLQMPLSAIEIFDLFRRCCFFPPLSPNADLQPDDTFILNYVVYHHFRSLGWVVRPGVKFGVDYCTFVTMNHSRTHS